MTVFSRLLIRTLPHRGTNFLRSSSGAKMTATKASSLTFFDDSCTLHSNNTNKNSYNFILVSLFHSTSAVELPARRRRRPSTMRGQYLSNGEGDGADDNDNDDDSSEETNSKRNSPIKRITFVQDTNEFRNAANQLLNRVEQGLEPMKAKNETFIVERSVGDLGEILTLDLGAKLGNYRIEFSNEEHVFEYSSPISGKILYVLRADTNEWVGMEDGHNFEGLLVRDLIRYCQGMPKF